MTTPAHLRLTPARPNYDRRNGRAAKTYTHEGITDTVRGWAARVRVPVHVMRSRLAIMPIERAVALGVGK